MTPDHDHEPLPEPRLDGSFIGRYFDDKYDGLWAAAVFLTVIVFAILAGVPFGVIVLAILLGIFVGILIGKYFRS